MNQVSKKLSLMAFFLAVVGFLAPVSRVHAQSAGASSADALPTMEELRTLAANKEWQPLLQKIQRVTSLRGSAAAGYDLYEVKMLKGEANLQLKQSSAAVSAFNDAGNDKGLDEKKSAVANASALLVKRSVNGIYNRKGPSTQPADPKSIDISDTSLRKPAFAALAADEAAALENKAKAAAAGTSLKPIAEMTKSIGDLREAEIASRDDTTTPITDGLLSPLATHAKELSTAAITRMKSQVETISQSANKLEDIGPSRSQARAGYGGAGPGVDHRFRKRGLTGNDTSTLKEIATTSKQLIAASKELAAAFGPKLGEPLASIEKEATEVGTRAESVLNDKYDVTTGVR